MRENNYIHSLGKAFNTASMEIKIQTEKQWSRSQRKWVDVEMRKKEKEAVLRNIKSPFVKDV